MANRIRNKSHIATESMTAPTFAVQQGHQENGTYLHNQNDTEEARISVIASIRDNVRHLSVDRVNEIFDDFDGAVKSRNLNYLADTVVNWAFGGHGYEYAGMTVNRSATSPRAPREGETGYEEWVEYKALRAQENGQL